jgi:hypothetical protein
MIAIHGIRKHGYTFAGRAVSSWPGRDYSAIHKSADLRLTLLVQMNTKGPVSSSDREDMHSTYKKKKKEDGKRRDTN